MKTSSLKKVAQQFGFTLLLGLCVTLENRTCLAQAAESLRTPPSWLRDGVVYEVFPRQFSADGNFKGVSAKLDELKDLGVTIVWLMPIHPIGAKLRKGIYGSPYAVSDYYAINPDYGNMDDLKHLISEAHRRGLKVILDMVLLHTAWDNVLMAHPEFYKHDATGKIIPPVREWTDVAGLNYANPELRKYMIAMLKNWVTETDIDGFRCDTASMVPTSFWETAGAELRRTKPDIMMLAEADKPELLTNAFDIDYAWPLLTTLKNVLEKSAPASELQRTWEKELRRYPRGSLRLNMSDNHDQARVVSRFGVQSALASSVLMFTLDGVPLLYNGMEVGDTTESGDPALFNRAPILWEQKDAAQVRGVYHDLIKLRQNNLAFRTGDVEWLPNSDAENLVTLIRRHGKDEFLVAINFSNHPLSAKVDLKNEEQFTLVKINGQQQPDNAGIKNIELNAFGWRIYHRSSEAITRN
jgi:cyclomaltodextrinase